MHRNTVLFAIVLMAPMALARHLEAAIYSPTQAQLLDMEWADFIDNEAPDASTVDSIVAVGADAKVTFDVDFDLSDSIWRTAMEYQNTAMDAPFDFTGLDAFSVRFTNPVQSESLPIRAQIFVRSTNMAMEPTFHSTQAFTISNIANFYTTLSLPTADIVGNGGTLSNITSFGIEFFADDFISDPLNLMVTAATAPQPPTVTESVLFSWETPDNLGTPLIDERLEGWRPNADEDPTETTHEISTVGATHPAVGGHSLQLNRTYTGQTFRWGSEVLLDSFAGGGGPLLGDYNGNNEVDAADYTVWRDTMTAGSSTLANDSTPGTVNESDFTYWRNNFGTTGGGQNMEVQAKIDELVDALDGEDAYSIVFDATYTASEDPFLVPDPGFIKFHFAIADAHPTDPEALGHWYQPISDDPTLMALPTVPGESVTQTIELLLSEFDDANQAGTNFYFNQGGIYDDTTYLRFLIATNLNGEIGAEFPIQIDNLRVRNIIEVDGAGSASAAIPEPASAFLALLAMGLGLSTTRRKVRQAA